MPSDDFLQDLNFIRDTELVDILNRDTVKSSDDEDTNEDTTDDDMFVDDHNQDLTSETGAESSYTGSNKKGKAKVITPQSKFNYHLIIQSIYYFRKAPSAVSKS